MPENDHSVVLFHPRTEHEENYRDYWIPYSVFSLSAVLVPEITVRIVDENLVGMPGPPQLDELLNSCFCVGISCMTGRQIANGLNFARLVRQARPEIPLVWGGAHPTLFSNEMLEHPLVDYVVLGPGERPFRVLIDALLGGQLPPKIKGLAWSDQDGKSIFHGGMAEARPNIDFPPFPWELLDLEGYVRSDDKIASRVLNYVSSQGCPFPCAFCSEVALHDRGWNAFPAQRVADDAQTLIKLAGINGLKFYDANFFVSIKRAMEFADRIKGLGLRWAASCHPATTLRLDSDQWGLLANSGLCRLLIGLESGSQAVLDLIHKRFRTEDMITVARRLANRRIVGSFTFIVGFPGVKDDLESTLKMGEQLRRVWSKHEVKVHFYAPYPGTPMWPTAIEYGFSPPVDLQGWADFDYYSVTTPWVDPAWLPIVRSFNQKHCPYVHV